MLLYSAILAAEKTWECCEGGRVGREQGCVRVWRQRLCRWQDSTPLLVWRCVYSL
jgi:hypothetical protein